MYQLSKTKICGLDQSRVKYCKYLQRGIVPIHERREIVSCNEYELMKTNIQLFSIRFKPEGRTDSEQVFCAIMNGLNAKFSSFPSLAELYSTIEELCLELVQKYEGTILNFLLGCGEGIQFAFSWPGSRPGSNTWNGLFYKQVDNDDDSICSGMEDESTSSKEENGQVAIIATKPLTNDDESSWVEFMRGDLLLFCNGQVFTSHTDLCQ